MTDSLQKCPIVDPHQESNVEAENKVVVDPKILKDYFIFNVRRPKYKKNTKASLEKLALSSTSILPVL